ncbi:hypothetical protein [Arthrobacter sp. JCM 19049]|uniref:hypothetical protein n=1 Tax=Arthrobacter sp. JCM 19049 TaxID=1460643 RepID=UPI000A82A4F1|nr:hypothetical protein [Arthrobacter sp. JCM 19049]
MGFDLPLIQQYFNYVSQWLTGDLGRSFVMNEDVSSLIAQRLPKTLILAIAAVGGACWSPSRWGWPRRCAATSPLTTSSPASTSWSTPPPASFWACC